MKKWITLLCALLVLMSVLAGCGSKKEVAEVTAPAATQQTAAETQPEAETSAKEESVAEEPAAEEVIYTAPTAATDPQTGEPVVQEFWGYVIDICCFEIPGPEEDTWDCLLMDSCRDSGYGLAIPDSNAPNGYIWYAFDEKGQQLAFDAILGSNKWTKISLKVTGTLENNIIHVKTLKEG